MRRRRRWEFGSARDNSAFWIRRATATPSRSTATLICRDTMDPGRTICSWPDCTARATASCRPSAGRRASRPTTRYLATCSHSEDFATNTICSMDSSIRRASRPASAINSSRRPTGHDRIGGQDVDQTRAPCGLWRHRQHESAGAPEKGGHRRDGQFAIRVLIPPRSIIAPPDGAARRARPGLSAQGSGPPRPPAVRSRGCAAGARAHTPSRARYRP